MKNKTTTWLVVITIYLLSTFGIYKYISIYYSKDGKKSTLDATTKDLIITFCPIVNTISNIVWIVEAPYKNKTNYNNFYNIKK